jgi:hypothetical protein
MDVAGSAVPKWGPEELVTTPSHDVDRLPMYGMKARARAKDFDGRPENERTHWWRVSDRIDRILAINWQADTATRYLES